MVDRAHPMNYQVQSPHWANEAIRVVTFHRKLTPKTPITSGKRNLRPAMQQHCNPATHKRCQPQGDGTAPATHHDSQDVFRAAHPSPLLPSPPLPIPPNPHQAQGKITTPLPLVQYAGLLSEKTSKLSEEPKPTRSCGSITQAWQRDHTHTHTHEDSEESHGGGFFVEINKSPDQGGFCAQCQESFDTALRLLFRYPSKVLALCQNSRKWQNKKATHQKETLHTSTHDSFIVPYPAPSLPPHS